MEQEATARRVYSSNSNFNNYNPIACRPMYQGEGGKSRRLKYMGALSEMTGPPIEERNATLAREKAYRERLRRDIEEREMKREEKRRAEESEKNREFEELTGQSKRRNETETRHKEDNNERTMTNYQYQRSSNNNGLVMHSDISDFNAATSAESEAVKSGKSSTNIKVNMGIPMDNEMTAGHHVNNCDNEFAKTSSYPVGGYTVGLQEDGTSSHGNLQTPNSMQQPTISIPLEDFEALNKLCHELLMEQKILREEVNHFKFQLGLQNETKSNTGYNAIVNANELDKRKYSTTTKKTRKTSNVHENCHGNRTRHRPSVGFGSSTQRGLGL